MVSTPAMMAATTAVRVFGLDEVADARVDRATSRTVNQTSADRLHDANTFAATLA
jgi:hypothetical protein